jgi:hypothetical protein
VAEEIRIYSARLSDAEELLGNLRPADLAECRAYGKPDLLEGLRESIRESDECWALRVSAGMLGVFGVGAIAPGVGSPWMLGTPLLDKRPRMVHAMARSYLQGMRTRYPLLLNFVHAENTRSVCWLARLGFTIHPPEPYGCLGEMFHRFEMHADV